MNDEQHKQLIHTFESILMLIETVIDKSFPGEHYPGSEPGMSFTEAEYELTELKRILK